VAPASLDLAGAEIELVPAFSRETRLRRAIETVLDDYDYVLIDCPPTLGLLTVNGLAAAHEVLVPIQCEYYALEGLGQLLRNVDLVKRNLNPTLDVSTIVCVMYDARTKLSTRWSPRSVSTSVTRSSGRWYRGRSGCRRRPPTGNRSSRSIPVRAAHWRTATSRRRCTMARRSGLGKGLSSLIPPGADTPASSDLSVPILVEIPLADIAPNPNQPRVHFDEETLSELASSIAQIGVLQPILVRPAASGDGYELIAGERRWRAAGRVGLATIPAVIRTSDDLGSVEQALVENLHRQDLTALEEAAAYQQLIEDFGLTHEQMAERVGKSRSAITNTLRLLGLPPSVQHLLADGKLSAGHARALLGTPDRALQDELARRAADEGWTVRAVEEAVRRGSAEPAIIETPEPAVPEDRPTVPPPIDGAGLTPSTRLRPPGLLELEELLADYLETRVSVHMGAKRGKVTVEFADLEDLERLYRRIISDLDTV
jgi:ParB family transcriptional regulator, chromosome partitioning protein